MEGAMVPAFIISCLFSSVSNPFMNLGPVSYFVIHPVYIPRDNKSVLSEFQRWFVLLIKVS